MSKLTEGNGVRWLDDEDQWKDEKVCRQDGKVYWVDERIYKLNESAIKRYTIRGIIHSIIRVFLQGRT